MNQALPKDITSYDLLKTFAIITMIIDHIGSYLLPELMWLRLIGRLSAPVWLFLIGYAKTRDIPLTFWISIVLLTGTKFIFGYNILPITIIFTMVITRLSLDFFAKEVFQSTPLYKHITLILLALFCIPTYLIVEYGTNALMIGMLGYACRHKDKGTSYDDINMISVYTIMLYSGSQILFLEFTTIQNIILIIITTVLVIMLQSFSSQIYQDTSKKIAKPLRAFIKICGRKTLEIYTLHIILFIALSKIIGIHDEPLFSLVLN